MLDTTVRLTALSAAQDKKGTAYLVRSLIAAENADIGVCACWP